MSDLVETLNLLADVWTQFMIRQSWQVGIVFLVVGAVTLALRRRSAVLCYCLWLLVLVRFLLPPDFAFVTGAGYWLPRLGVRTEPEFAVSAPVDVAPPRIPLYPLQIEEDLPPRDFPREPSFPQRYEPVEEARPAEIRRASTPRLTLSAILMLVWTAMVATVLILLMKRSRAASRILRDGRPVTEEQTVALAEECRAAVRLRRAVRLLSSSRVPMPVAIGVLRPSVVVPDRLLEELTRDELRAVFLHEFLHLKRFDPLVSFVQRVVQAFYLYHPAAWLANGMLDVLRERICDDHVLALMCTDSETYGETLVRAVELAPSGVPASGGLVSIAESKRQLKDRLQRIAQVDRKLVYRLSLASILALVCIAAVVLPLGQIDSGETDETTEESPNVGKPTIFPKTGPGKGAVKGAQKTGIKDEAQKKDLTGLGEARSTVFGDPLWREFMRAYNALESKKAVALGEEFLEKYGNEPEALTIYGFVAAAYGYDESTSVEVREERRKTVLERGIAACERALEKGDPVDKLGMLATLGRLCGMRAVGPGWQDEVYARKGIDTYREAIDIAEPLLRDSDDDDVRRTVSALLWSLYKGIGFIYETQENFPAAVAVYEEALKHRELAERRSLIQQALAETYHKCGKRAEEMQTYLDAIEEAPTHKTRFKPSVKKALIEMYQAAVSATTDVQTLETLSSFADVYRRTAVLIARDAAAIAESRNLPQWRVTSWQNLLPVADLLVDYCSQANAPERRDGFYTLLLKVWPEDERFESVMLVRLGKLYEEMGRRQDAVNAYRRVMAIDHKLTMGERLEARARLQELGEEVKIVQGESVGDKARRSVSQLFEQADRLAARKKQRSREYLTALPDDQLAMLYVKATAAAQLQRTPSDRSAWLEPALQEVKKDRQKVVDAILKSRTPLSEQDEETFRLEYEKLADQLAALGPEAVPAIAQQMDRTFMTTGRLPLARQAILKVGKDAVEPLTGSIESDDSWLRRHVTDLLSKLADPRSKETLLRALEDDDGSVRRYALEGLVNMGPDVVGADTLREVLVKRLEDDYDWVRDAANDGLARYGDERAIDPLSVIERLDLSQAKKSGVYYARYRAREAMNAILRRAGKPVKEVSREDYGLSPPSFEQLCEAAECPNAGIRGHAIRQLGYRKDEETARFLLERLRAEQEPRTLPEICDSLAGVMTLPSKSTTPVVPAELMQEGFDSLIHIAQTHGSVQVKVAAIRGVSRVLYAADQARVPLHGIERFKELVREGVSAKDETFRIPCYSAVTTVARVSPETAPNWSALERGQLQEQLAPLLDAPNPQIRLIECLGYVGDRGLTPRMMELLHHSDASIRRFAAYALGRIGDPATIDALKRVAATDPYQYEDGRYGVREAASRALQRILEKKDDPTRHERIGLQLVIRSDKEVYAAGDAIWLSVYLVNVGDRPVTLYAPQAPLLPPEPMIEVVRWSIKGGKTVSRPKGELLGTSLNVQAKVVEEERWIRKPGRDDFTGLSPGEEIQLWSANAADERFRLTWGDKPNPHDLRSPGQYVLRARYSNQVAGKDVGLNAWTGSIRSDELTVLVE